MDSNQFCHHPMASSGPPRATEYCKTQWIRTNFVIIQWLLQDPRATEYCKTQWSRTNFVIIQWLPQDQTNTNIEQLRKCTGQESLHFSFDPMASSESVCSGKRHRGSGNVSLAIVPGGQFQLLELTIFDRASTTSPGDGILQNTYDSLHFYFDPMASSGPPGQQNTVKHNGFAPILSSSNGFLRTTLGNRIL